MNKKYIIRLTEQERVGLTRLVNTGKVAAGKRRHAEILLKADAGPQGPAWSDGQIVAALGVSERTVEAVRQRCVEEGLEAAVVRRRQCRPSRQRILDGAKEAKLVAVCCSKAPAGRARWTLAMLADELVRLEIVEDISSETVRRTLKKMS